MGERLILNIAEKPSVARGIADVLRGTRRLTYLESASKFNPVLAIDDYNHNGEICRMVFTSVRGHLTDIDYSAEYQDWQRHSPFELFGAEIIEKINDKNLEKNLSNYSRQAAELILWLDCDREGEAICFEVIGVCATARRGRRQDLPPIKRAHFSSVTQAEVIHALENLQVPNEKQARAVNARRELDLRIGTSLTRLMTKGLMRKFQVETNVLSYGPCQMPTLGFVVSRWIRIQRTQPQQFYYIIAEVTEQGTPVAFKSTLPNFFDKVAATLAYKTGLEANYAEITDVIRKATSHRRPKPMNTLTLTKLCSIFFKMPSYITMQIAEKLYTKGFTSYPRTETEIFPPSTDLKGLVGVLGQNPEWSDYGNKLLNEDKFLWPIDTGRTDQAHPPIHPVKCMIQRDATDPQEWQVYQLIAKHFLACVSQDAVGQSTQIAMRLVSDRDSATALVFDAKGLVITETNFLEIYQPFDSWKGTQLPDSFTSGQRVDLTSLLMKVGETTVPRLLSEQELITLMDKFQIGTDATMHEHIKTITTRQYVERVDQNYFKPTLLGVAIFLGLHNSCPQLTQPQIRAEMERAVAAIANGELDPRACVLDFIGRYKGYFQAVSGSLSHIENVLRQWLQPRN